MPSFSLFRNRGEEAHRVDIDWHYSDVDAENYGKISPRGSRRAYLRKLLKKPSLSSISDKSLVQQNDTFYKPSRQLELKEEKTSEITLALLYKPLPPTPPPDASVESLLKRSNKTNRIITPLVLTDLQELFSGAPQFNVNYDQDVHGLDLPKPSVTFPWDLCFRTKNLIDHVVIDDPAWACVTASKNSVLLEDMNAEDAKERRKQMKIGLISNCRELPNMLSMQGIEKGSMGFQAAMEVAVADRIATSDLTPWEVLSSNRASFLQRKDQLRSVSDSALVNRLITIGEIYHQPEPLQCHKPTFQLYTELFTKLLLPSSQILDIDDPYSLQVQVYHLIEILNAPKLWVDFSNVKWRIQIARILWGTDEFQTFRTSDFLDIAVGIRNFHSKKYWLLLQILLGCEVILRLDILCNKIKLDDDSSSLEKMNFFGQKRTESAKWTLLLARTWLDNIRLEIVESDKIESTWITGENKDTDSFDLFGKLKFQGRNTARQVSGLLHFAQALKWPNMDILEVNTKRMYRNHSCEVNFSKSTRELSNASCEVRDFRILNRKYDDKKKSLNKWLSDSYMSGLILPGEGLSHVMIASLLENDPHALSRVGNRINPSGALIYGGRSFWSTRNVVGKVLAARKNSSECMGWVSSDVFPRGVKEGWIDIEVHSRQENYQHKKPRIYHKKTVERHGSVIAGADASSILRGDFVLPSEKSIYYPLQVKFLSLVMFALDKEELSYGTEFQSDEVENGEFPLFSASMRFSVESTIEKQKELSIDLAHDIYFISAHPCLPRTDIETLLMPTNSSFQSLPPRSPTTGEGSGHPLHKAFTYTKITLSHILNTPLKTSFATLLTPPTSPNLTQSSLHTTSSNIPRVLVLDCTDQDFNLGMDNARDKNNSDREMLARAICAERGWNALISRKSLCCLACSIREASALGHRVIIRL